MNLYLLEQDVNSRYDTYDSCVVVAESEEAARLINPEGAEFGYEWTTWAHDPTYVTVTYIGVATDNLEAGTIICSSFNAG